MQLKRSYTNYIEGELASAIAIAETGYAVPPGPWRKNKKFIWSAIDLPANKKMVYRRAGRRAYGRPMRRRRGRYTKRRFGRKRSRWGVRVRRAAVKLSESKRLYDVSGGSLNDVEAGSSALVSIPLCRVPHYETSPGSDSKNTRMGVTILPTGVSLKMQFENLKDTEDMVVRIIVGWKKYNRGAGENDDIFMNKEFETNQELDTLGSYFEKMIAPLDKKQFVKRRDFKIGLTGKRATEFGTTSKMIKLWIPMKKFIKYEANSVSGSETQTYDPIVYMYCYNKSGTALATGANAIRYNIERCFYFRDP